MPGCYVVFHKQLGDLVLLEPALTKLCAHHGAPVECLTRSGHGPLLQLMPGVRFRGGLPFSYHGYLYCFDSLSKSALRSLFAPSRVKKCVLRGKDEMRWYHAPLFRDLIVPELGDRYVAEYFWESTPVPSDKPFRPPQLAHPPEHWKPDGFEGAPFVLVNPTSGWKQKSWLPDCWARMLTALHEESGLRFVMTSGSLDWQIQHCREIEEKSGQLLCNLANGTSLRNFLWLCSRALTVLTVDGAASHLARAFGVRSVTLFGPTNRQNWHFPSQSSVAIQAPPSKDRVCRLRNLSAEEVIATVGRFLRATEPDAA